MLAFGGSADVVVYNGRSHYGDEQVVQGLREGDRHRSVELRGGTAPELFERLRREGADTPADVLVTTDLANLWRAKEAGLLQPVTTPTLERQRARAQLRDPDGDVVGAQPAHPHAVRSTERVPAGAVTSYEDLGDPRFKGRLCLRTSNNEYNQSLVADMIAKRGDASDRALLRVLDGQRPADPRLRRRGARRRSRPAPATSA